MLVNTQYFRDSARFFEKHGHYDDGEWNTTHYNDFWDEEYRRCCYGYKVGDTWITGYHYWYLNYWPILLNRKTEDNLYGEVTKTRKSKGKRVLALPDFWDVDYEFFHEIEKAEQEGKHFVWLKPRGVGASYKGSSMAGRNFFLIPDSKGFLFAYEKEFLIKDGLYTKFVSGRKFINRRHPTENRYLTSFSKPSDYKKDFNGMHYRASTDIDGEELGFMSEVIGTTFKDDWQKGRGKRGKLILWEEMGKFPLVDRSWNIARTSTEEEDITFGLMLGFGTGGTEGADFSALERMFYNPDSYGIRCFDNIWDDEFFGTKCAYFSPAYKTIRFKDSDGNSDINVGKKHYEEERKLAAKSPDPGALLQAKAEKPFTPQEAILSTVNNNFPVREAREWRLQIISSDLCNLGIPGRITDDGEALKFKPDYSLKPITEFPHKKSDNLEGCIVRYFSPYKVDGKIPDNLYIIAHDPYAFNSSVDGTSLGATYVYMQPNNLQPPGDKIVATYFGRPHSQDEYNKNLFLLSYYYNAKIGFENDRGDVIGYAKRFK